MDSPSHVVSECDAHEISLRDARGEASTEQLRQALVHYRTPFAELLVVSEQCGEGLD